MSFKIKKTELLGRIGILEVSGKRVETPAFLPVIHPVNQLISAKEIRDMGFNAAITNSYIAYKYYGDRILDLGGIHGVTKFDGLLMTDSGGYQVLEYGDIDVDPRTIAEYQIKMGSDIAVVLDKPTGAKASRRQAELTVKETLEAARSTLKYVEETSGKMLWAIPVQGGVHLDLVAYSAGESSKLGYDVYAIGSPVELMNNYQYDKLAKLILTAKSRLPPEKPVHLFGAGHPLTMALAVALGADTFDSASYIIFARGGRYMTHCGVRRIEELEEFPCSCPVCSKRSPKELLEMGKAERVAELARHNLYVLRSEMHSVKIAVKEGRLWELLLNKTYCHPSLKGVRQILLEYSKELRENTYLFKKKALMLFDSLDVNRPELQEARSRVSRFFNPRSESVVLVAVSSVNDLGEARRLYLLLVEEGYSDKTIFFVQPFLGITPIGLADSYPFSHTIMPSVDNVGDDVLEKTASSVASTLASWKTRRVVLLDTGTERFTDVLAGALRSRGLHVEIKGLSVDR